MSVYGVRFRRMSNPWPRPDAAPDSRVWRSIQPSRSRRMPISRLKGASLIVNAIPTQFIRPVWERLGSGIGGVPVVSVAKGIENETLLRPSEIISQVVTQAGLEPGSMCALSGPTIATELVDHLPAVMVAAATDPAVSTLVQDWLRVPWMRIYTHDDLLGVELAGAAKNVIALAAGMVDGLRAGDNAKSAVLARGFPKSRPSARRWVPDRRPSSEWPA